MAEPSWAGGLNTGLVKGLQIGSMFEEGKARKEAREKRGRDETRAEAKAERDALLTQIKAAGNVLKVGGLPEEIYFDNMDIIFSNTSKLMGVEYPGMDSYNKALEEEAKALDNLRAQYQAGKINKSTYFQGALAISKNVLIDPIKKEPFERGLKAADEERGILLRQEARVLLDYLQADPAKQTITPKIQELIGKARKNPQWGGRLAEEVDKLKKENRTALLPGTGYKTTTTGVRVMDTKEGRVALIGRKQVFYDESIHGQLEETPPQAGVPSAKDFTLKSLDKYRETGKYGDLERRAEKVTPPKTPTKIQVAMRAAGIPTETPIGEMSEDDAVKVLVKLKEYGATQGDFFGFLEQNKHHRGSGFTGFLHRVLDYFTSGGYGEEDEKVLKSVLDK